MKLFGGFLLLLASFLIPAGNLRALEKERRAAREIGEFLSRASAEISFQACPAPEMIAAFWNGRERRALSFQEVMKGVEGWGDSGLLLRDYVASLSRSTVEGGLRLTETFLGRIREEETRLSGRIEEVRRLRLPLYPALTLLILLVLL